MGEIGWHRGRSLTIMRYFSHIDHIGRFGECPLGEANRVKCGISRRPHPLQHLDPLHRSTAFPASGSC